MWVNVKVTAERMCREKEDKTQWQAKLYGNSMICRSYFFLFALCCCTGRINLHSFRRYKGRAGNCHSDIFKGKHVHLWMRQLWMKMNKQWSFPQRKARQGEARPPWHCTTTSAGNLLSHDSWTQSKAEQGITHQLCRQAAAGWVWSQANGHQRGSYTLECHIPPTQPTSPHSVWETKPPRPQRSVLQCWQLT